MKRILLLLSILSIGLSLSAQSEDELFGSGDEQLIEGSEDELFGSSEDELFGGDEDDLFGGEGDLVEEAESSDTAMADLLLVDEEGVRIGGSYNLGFSASGGFDPDIISSVDDVAWDFTPDLSASLFLDARPDKDIRIFAKAAVEYPFAISEDDPDTPDVDETRNYDDIVYIKELFSDFNIGDSLFFRAGKQTINWGVGRYFSPADLLNLTEIDPEDPDSELEGPLSVKMHLPVESHNLYLYTVVPDGIEDPADLAFAPKAEFVIGGTELGIGAYYRYEQSPAAMFTFTTAIWDIDLFGEGVVQYGSDKNFVKEEGGVYTLETFGDKIFFKGTLGASFIWNHDESDFSISASGQYYFNGEGYSDPSVLNSSLAPGALWAYPQDIQKLTISDLMDRSMHYGAASLSVTPVEDLSFSVFWMGNFNDMSGLVKPGINWNATDYISLGLSVPWNYGDAGDEYAPSGNNLSFALEVSLGRTSF